MTATQYDAMTDVVAAVAASKNATDVLLDRATDLCQMVNRLVAAAQMALDAPTSPDTREALVEALGRCGATP